ncbi:winged helix-turn-helix transcriptional regulator [Streptomyces inhibens]|uniref:winged helix-turn-helix transcriptional regulator n=1 Tax=Streptomyces inhibens TaxID=2293571 RepID=UPI001EE6E6B6|nr:winged helix-turn-helix transcriptional regulator [Streptomyces inhibens]UKY54168.1 winged helix-turn-helix transcriptional regulator [Streptomyces inhibens]
MTSTFHQEHPDAALARDPVPPKLINTTHPWNGAPPKLIDKRRHLLLDKATPWNATAWSTRTVYPTIPPKVVYERTELGHSLTGLLTAIQDWSEEHQDEVLAARRAYDRRAAAEVEPVRPAGDS